MHVDFAADLPPAPWRSPQEPRERKREEQRRQSPRASLGRRLVRLAFHSSGILRLVPAVVQRDQPSFHDQTDSEGYGEDDEPGKVEGEQPTLVVEAEEHPLVVIRVFGCELIRGDSGGQNGCREGGCGHCRDWVGGERGACPLEERADHGFDRMAPAHRLIPAGAVPLGREVRGTFAETTRPSARRGSSVSVPPSCRPEANRRGSVRFRGTGSNP